MEEQSELNNEPPVVDVDDVGPTSNVSCPGVTKFATRLLWLCLSSSLQSSRSVGQRGSVDTDGTTSASNVSTISNCTHCQAET